MKLASLWLVAAGLLAGVLSAADTRHVPRFSVDYMNKSVAPGADFAQYAFGNWQKESPIPADKARWGAFNELDQYNQAGLHTILETAASKSHEPGSVEQKVGD